MTNTGPCVVAFETDPNHPGLHRLLRSLEKHKWQHNIILDPHWRGFGHRLKRTVETCRDLVGRYTHIISVDSRDVVAVGPPGEWIPPPVPLLYAAEQALWPPVPGLAERYPFQIPWPSLWRHAHSPFIIDLKHIDLLAADGIDNLKDDQLHAHERFLSGNPDIQLDTQCKYIQSIAHCHPWDKFFAVEGERVRNLMTGSRPLWVHGNGTTTMDWVPGCGKGE